MAMVIELNAKSHHFVLTLTVLRPISSSHELTTDLSCFNEKSNSKKNFGVVGSISKLDINT